LEGQNTKYIYENNSSWILYFFDYPPKWGCSISGWALIQVKTLFGNSGIFLQKYVLAVIRSNRARMPETETEEIQSLIISIILKKVTTVTSSFNILYFQKMYYFKLIFYIFLLIFINISDEEPKQKTNLLSHRRCKRGNNIRGCFGGGNRRSNQPFRQRKGKAHVVEGSETEIKGGNSKKRALYIFDNFFFSHVQLNVNIFF